MKDAQAHAAKELIAGVYDRAAPIYGQIGPDLFSYFGQQLVEFAEIPEGARVLDVAAGRGAVLFAAAPRVGPNGRVIGIDLAEGMVRETSAEITRRQLTNAEMRQMDAEQLAFADASFDRVLCSLALFLFPDLARALAEFYRVLKPGGLVAFTFPQPGGDARWKWYGELFERYHAIVDLGFEHERNEVESQLQERGFVQIETRTEGADFVYATAEEWWQSQWSHGPRRHLERMEPQTLEQFQADAFRQLQSFKQANGIPERVRLLLIRAAKPQEM